ncbi:MAG: response regulator [Myxococcales bacterium]|nr:response regulator [Myxococcales bacterium]
MTPPDEPCVLVVDDDPLMGRAVARLVRARCPTDVATSPDEALARLAERRYRAVLCDMRFTGLEQDGAYLFEQVKAADPAQAARFVFMTGGMGDARYPDFLATTGCPVLDKPFTPEALDAVLDPLLAE